MNHRPVHFEILGDDPETSSRFYADVFGWDIAKWEGPQTYWMAKTGEEGTPGIDGGFMQKHFDQPVINTIQVESLEETQKKVEAAGGALFHGPDEVPGVGLHAYFKDPGGILFGVMQPGAAQ